jgi:hypothetical protein
VVQRNIKHAYKDKVVVEDLILFCDGHLAQVQQYDEEYDDDRYFV